MVNNRLKESMKSLWISHMDPEKDEQQKWMNIGNTFSPKQQPQSPQYYWRLWDHSSIESTQRMQARCSPGRGFFWSAEYQRLRQIDTKVRRILKLIKSINQGNKEVNVKKKSELIQLVEDLHKQYQSLYALYDDLKEGIRNKVNDGEENGSSSSSSVSAESDSYFSPDDLSSRNSESSLKAELQKVTTEDVNPEHEASYLDEASEVVKEALNVEPMSSSSMAHDSEEEAEIMTQKLMEESSFLKERLFDREKEVLSLTTAHQVLENEASAKIKELEGQVAMFKLELEKLSSQKVELEEKFGCNDHNEAKKLREENLGLQAHITAFEERENGFSAALKKFEENEKDSIAKIDEFTKKAENLQKAVDSLHTQKHELEEQLLSATNKESAQAKSLTDQINHLEQELKSLSSQKNEREMELEKKSQEISECVVQIESLKDKLERKTSDEKEERQKLNLLLKDLEMELDKKSREMSEYVTQIESLKEKLERKTVDEKKEGEKLNLRVKDLEMELDKKSREMSEYVMQMESLKDKLERKTEDEKEGEKLNLRVKDLEMELERKSRETSERVMQIESLKEKLERKTVDEKEEGEKLNLRVKDLEMELKKRTRETSEYVMQIESLKEKLKRKDVDGKEARHNLDLRVKDLEVETSSLTSAKSDLEEKLKSINDEANQSKVEKEELYARIFELEGKVREKENGVSTLQKKIEVYENESKSLKQKLDSLQSEKRLVQLQNEKERQECWHSITRLQELNKELTVKISEKDKILEEQEDVMKKLSQEHKQVHGNLLDSKLSLKVAERKMEEMAEEFRKKFEDNIRLLSRRIRVAEQLHAESKDWYKNTQEQFEQDQRSNREAFEKIKVITVDASEILVGLDTMGLKFIECWEHFMNRISKVSCELHFVQDWVVRKNKAIKLVKEDFDCVLAQLDIKEEEILGLRQKVWKLENKVRELEKMGKENEEGMLVLKEEKREAIRQLCVWIDYHRGRSDYLKKALTEVTSRNQTRSL